MNRSPLDWLGWELGAFCEACVAAAGFVGCVVLIVLIGAALS